MITDEQVLNEFQKTFINAIKATGYKLTNEEFQKLQGKISTKMIEKNIFKALEKSGNQGSIYSEPIRIRILKYMPLLDFLFRNMEHSDSIYFVMYMLHAFIERELYFNFENLRDRVLNNIHIDENFSFTTSNNVLIEIKKKHHLNSFDVLSTFEDGDTAFRKDVSLHQILYVMR